MGLRITWDGGVPIAMLEQRYGLSIASLVTSQVSAELWKMGGDVTNYHVKYGSTYMEGDMM